MTIKGWRNGIDPSKKKEVDKWKLELFHSDVLDKFNVNPLTILWECRKCGHKWIKSIKNGMVDSEFLVCDVCAKDERIKRIKENQ